MTIKGKYNSDDSISIKISWVYLLTIVAGFVALVWSNLDTKDIATEAKDLVKQHIADDRTSIDAFKLYRFRVFQAFEENQLKTDKLYSEDDFSSSVKGNSNDRLTKLN